MRSSSPGEHTQLALGIRPAEPLPAAALVGRHKDLGPFDRLPVLGLHDLQVTRRARVTNDEVRRRYGDNDHDGEDPARLLAHVSQACLQCVGRSVRTGLGPAMRHSSW
jgi:hypothetical protein